MPIGVYVVDGHFTVREGLRSFIAAHLDLALAGTAAAAAEAIPRIEAAPPDVLLLGVDLGPEDGLALLPRLLAAAPRTRLLIHTALLDRTRHEEALLAGAHGLVGKEAPPETLLKAIRKVHEGQLWFERPLLETALRRAVRGGLPRPVEAARLPGLTDRERCIVGLIGRGLRNAAIAEELGIAPKTVRNQLSIIYDKLDVADRLELLILANERPPAAGGAAPLAAATPPPRWVS